jgi:hypothetical protein
LIVRIAVAISADSVSLPSGGQAPWRRRQNQAQVLLRAVDTCSMDARPKSSHYTRPLTLPSGRQIEVVYFESPNEPRPADQPDLHRCGGCGCEFVQPVDWAPASKTYWTVTLRCPNCEWSGTGVYEQDVVDRFDDELNRGAAILAGEVQRISLENMSESLERFVAALHAGHIIPADF